VLFFNAFELGAESANQVFLEEALRSTAEVLSIRHCISSTKFLKTLCDHALVHSNHQITEKIFGTNPSKIIFKNFIQSQKLARYRYFGFFVVCTNNLYR
jgi:hypothetical protein